MVYIYNMKSSGWKVPPTIGKDGKKVNVLYIVDRNHQRSAIAVDHSKYFKGDVGYSGEIIIQEEEIIV